MTRRQVRLLLGVTTALLVAGFTVFGFGQARHSAAVGVRGPDSALATSGGGSAAAVKSTASKTVRVARPHLSRPLRDMAPLRAARPSNKAENESFALRGSSSARDAAVQASPGTGMPAPMQNFEGLGNVDGAFRPDTSGDVGPNNYMQWINLSFAIFNKQGSMVYGPAAGSTLFPGTSVCGTRNGGDPIVLYDQLAHRWFASQSAYQSLVNGPYYQCVAVSRTSDPTGEWCAYQFLSHTTKFTDYSKFGIWPAQHAYVMSSPQYLRAASFAGIGVWAFERDQILACQPARVVYQDMTSIAPNLPRMLPADVDGPTAPPAGTAAPLLTMNWNGSGLPANTLQLWNATVDWSASPSVTVTHQADLSTASYDSNLCNYARSCIAQPGTTSKVDAMSDRLMYRLAYRNFGNRQVMVVNHTVDTGNDHAGIRWYELSKTSGAWAIAQQGTYSPDSLNRFMGSAAMDRMGNMAIGYSVSDGTSTYPGVRYAGRLASDPAGQLSQGERTLATGSGAQTQSSSHWGDYSMMSVDPSNDCTFWYSQEYYVTTGKMSWSTRIGSFKFPNCVSPSPNG